MKLVSLLFVVIVAASAGPAGAQGQRSDPCNYDQQHAAFTRWAATARHLSPAEAARSHMPTWEQQQAQTARLNAWILRSDARLRRPAAPARGDGRGMRFSGYRPWRGR